MKVRLFFGTFILLLAFSVFGEGELVDLGFVEPGAFDSGMKKVEVDPLSHEQMEKLADEILDEFFYEENEMYLSSTFDSEDSDPFESDSYLEEVDAGPTTVSQVDDFASKVISKIPFDGIRKGLEEYRAIIDAKSYRSNKEVGDRNTGLVAHMENMVDGNPCFASMVDQFYSDIEKLDKKYSPYFSKQVLNRPSQKDFSGKGVFKDLEPGWLWEKALKASKGNPNIAARILGVCGHDDIEQGEFSYQKEFESADEKQKFFDRYTETVRKNIALHMEYNNSVDDMTRMMLATYMLDRERFKSITKGKSAINCPKRDSVMYLNQALGDNIDISDDLRKRIISAQAPTKGGAALPAKNYHIYGALYMACRMAEEGMSPILATKLQKTAAWAYRTLRMDKVINDGIDDMKRISKVAALYKKATNSPKLDDISAIEKVLGRVKSKCDQSSWQEIEVFNGYYCHDVINTFGGFLTTGFEFDPKGIAQKMFAKADAAKLLEDAGIGGGKLPFTDQKIPHTNFLIRKPGMIEIMPYHWPGFGMINYTPATVPVGKPKGWGLNRFKRAVDKMETYLADWDWTTDQHGVGAAFGAIECTPMNVGEEVDDIACDILNSQDSDCGRPKDEGMMSRFFKSLNRKILLE